MKESTKMRKTSVRIDEGHGTTLTFYRLGSGKPRVLVTAAIHGDEVVGTFAIRGTIPMLDRKKLRGSVTFLPVANPLAFRCRERASPIDNADLNRVFPGEEKGSVSQRIAHTLWQEATQADYVLDLHGCGMNCIPYILSLHQEFDFIRKYARRLAIPTVVESSGLRGQLFIEASHKKIPAAIIEAGSHHGEFKVDHASQLKSVILELLASLKMIDGKGCTTQHKFYGKISNVKAEEEDFFIPRVTPGAFVKKGDVVGVTSFRDRDMLTQHTGIITSIYEPQVVFPGDSIASIAEEI